MGCLEDIGQGILWLIGVLVAVVGAIAVIIISVTVFPPLVLVLIFIYMVWILRR